MDTATQYLNLTASFITIAGIIFVIQTLFKWRNSPRFSIGVLPVSKEQQEENIGSLGKRSLFDEFIFDKRVLAKKLDSEDEIPKLEFDNDSSRSVYRDNAQHVCLPIIIQNDGQSEAKSYSLILSFTHSGIRIADIKTEGMTVDCLYTQDDSYIKNKELTGHMPAEELRGMYQRLNLVSDYLALEGQLASGSFEAIFLKLYVPPECEGFAVLFKIDCADFFYCQRQVNGQHINIYKDKGYALEPFSGNK